MASYCPQCNEPNESHVERCAKCGTTLKPEAARPPESPGVERSPAGSPWIINDSLAATESKEKCPKCGSPYVLE